MHQMQSPFSETLGSRVHVLGISGTLMGSFALFLKRLGFQVTGSDQGQIYPPMSDLLKAADIPIYLGYSAENLNQLPAPPDWVLVGNVIRRENPEMQAVVARGYRYLSLPQALEESVLLHTDNVVIAGTHGKTTTTSGLSFVLKNCGKRLGYSIGGVCLDLPTSFEIPTPLNTGKGVPALFVLEGDEYDTAFWDKVPKFNHYRPKDVILTSVEHDHVDIYSDFKAVKKAFRGLLERIPETGRLIACWNDAGVREVVTEFLGSQISSSSFSVVRYGHRQQASDSEDLDFYFDALRVESDWTVFDVYSRGGKWQETLKIRLSGTYSALNALAIWIEARALGLESSCVKDSLAKFRGVKRRQELRAQIGEISVFDDFAHHPTAVRETLKGFRWRYPHRRLIAIFEPRSASSRRKVFQDDYLNAFSGQADAFWIASPDLGNVPLEEAFSSEELVSSLKARGQSAFLISSVLEAVSALVAASQPGDLLIVFSNGSFQNLIPLLIEGLERRFQPHEKDLASKISPSGL